MCICCQALFGTTVEEARWRDCVRYVQGSMVNAVGALYVQEAFAGDSKRVVGTLPSTIKNTRMSSQHVE